MRFSRPHPIPHPEILQKNDKKMAVIFFRETPGLLGGVGVCRGGEGFGRQLAHTPEPQGKIRRDGMWTPCRQIHSDVGTLLLNHGAMPQDSKTSAVIRFEVGGGWEVPRCIKMPICYPPQACMRARVPACLCVPACLRPRLCMENRTERAVTAYKARGNRVSYAFTAYGYAVTADCHPTTLYMRLGLAW